MNNNAKNTTIVLASGGTGGHIFPAEALAEILSLRGYNLWFFTDRRNQPSKGKLAHIPTKALYASGIAGKGKIDLILSLVKLGIGTLQAIFNLLKLRPRLVVGFGGYSSIPAIVAARILAIPYIIHEQNAILGRANALVAGGATAIALSFAKTDRLEQLDHNKTTWVGNPVRTEIAALMDLAYQEPKIKEAFQLLIIGGSQGAKIFSEILPKAVFLLVSEDQKRLSICQQARKDDIAKLKDAWSELNINAEVQSFFDDMPKRLAKAHLVIARAGASSIAELTLTSRPALLIPYPHSADNHQDLNAARLSDAAGAWTIPQKDLTPEWLAKRLEDFLHHPEILGLAAKATRKLAKPNAAIELADLIESNI